MGEWPGIDVVILPEQEFERRMKVFSYMREHRDSGAVQNFHGHMKNRWHTFWMLVQAAHAPAPKGIEAPKSPTST